MAMKYSRVTIFAAALLALAVMTVLSVAMGAITTVIPRYITYYVSTALFGKYTQFRLLGKVQKNKFPIIGNLAGIHGTLRFYIFTHDFVVYFCEVVVFFNHIRARKILGS